MEVVVHPPHDFPTTGPALTSHYLEGSGREVVGRAIGVGPSFNSTASNAAR